MTPARVTPEIRLSPQDFGRATRIRNALVADLGGPTNVSNGEAILADFGGLSVLLAQRAAKLQDWELFKTWLGQARATLTTLGLARRARSVERDVRDVWDAMREPTVEPAEDPPQHARDAAYEAIDDAALLHPLHAGGVGEPPAPVPGTVG